MEKSRDASSPTRYLLKIESFSLLSENGIYKYESNEFESGGFNWKMIIHPEGEGEGDGDGHISVYLAIIEKSAVWEVNASFSFLIFDQIHDNYTVMKGMERRFRNIKNEWGFSKCISHKTFKDPSNGYLVNDKCVFGVDVYVIKNQGIGDIQQNGKNISIFLVSVDANGFDRQKRVKANFTISLKNRFDGEHHKFSGGAHWYSAAANSWGWSSFMGCCELNDPKNGFLIEDCCIVEAELFVWLNILQVRLPLSSSNVMVGILLVEISELRNSGRGWDGLDRLGFSRPVVPAPVITGLGDGTDKWKIFAGLAGPGLGSIQTRHSFRMASGHQNVSFSLSILFLMFTQRTNTIHERLTDVVLDGFTCDISYSYLSNKENGKPGKLRMITKCLPPSIRFILFGSLGKQWREEVYTHCRS
ncbi:hypothetical protein KY284_019408 [Solanum tuberosum]|nr:hypothetical protein KY284_019408 [Solanum tuberosum]